MKKKLLTLLLALVAIATTGRAQNKINGHEYVDLGLPSGTLWATCNVGATKPEEYGDYFAWGETDPKDDYDFFKNYKYFDINITKGFTKYTNSDGKKELEQNDDAAYVKWGNSWCIPSYDQIIELYENCNYKPASLNGVNGYYFTSNKNGRSIFFPYSGYYDGNQLKEVGTVGYFWTRTISMISTAGEDFAHTLYMSSSHSNMYVNHRYKGLAIRPVAKALTTPGEEEEDIPTPAEAIDLGLPSGTLWASHNLGATKPEEHGDFFAWGDTKGHKSGSISFDWSNYKWHQEENLYNGRDRRELATEDDAASVNWGNNWQIPSLEQIKELQDNCSWEWTIFNGVNGCKVTGANGNYIFLPAAGVCYNTTYFGENRNGYYWSRSLWDGNSSFSYRMFFSKEKKSYNYNQREEGLSIRPVKSSSSTGPNLTLGTKVLTLTMGESVALTYTYEPADADISAMTWTTSDSSVATVDRNGVVTAVSEGSCLITVSCGTLGQQECRVTVDNVTGVSSGHEYVDLGLPSGTLWATTNVGAETPGETGTLFSWVETEGNAATASWGPYWQMPIREQLEELIDGTSSVYTSLNDTEGFLLTSLTNGKCIFLPVTSSTNGCYWSGTSAGGNKAYALNYSRTTGDILTFNTSEQLAIRPVYNESVVEGSTFTVSAGNLDFGTVAVGSRRSMSFGIHNNTFGVINVKPFGVDADDFFVDWTGGKIQPNATQSVNVTYSPSKETVAAGGSLLIATAIDSLFVNVAASSHKSGDELTTKANLVVWCKNGAKVSFLLNDKPIVKIKDGKWKIDGNKTSAEYDVADVVKITYDGIPDDIPTIGVEIGKPFTIEGDVLTFFSDSEDLHVRIVALSGVVVKQFVARRGSASPVPLNQFASGVYIVNVNNISYKISIR